MEKDKDFANKQLLKKSIEINIVGEIVRLYDMGMDSKTAMDIITQVLWNGTSSVAQEALKSIKKQKEELINDEEDNDLMPEFNDDFVDEDDDNMKGGLNK